MGEARRRKLAGEPAPVIKLPPRKQMQGLRVVHHQRREITRDGMVYAQHVFAVLMPDSDQVMAEESPDGPKPVLISSVLQPIRRSVLVGV